VAESKTNSGEDPVDHLIEIYIRILRGEETAEERELIFKELENPHSQFRDMLDGASEYMTKRLPTVGPPRQMPYEEAGDRMIADAIARRHREDVVVFLRTKRAEGKLTDEEFSSLVNAGVIQPGPGNSLASQQLEESSQRMLQLALKLQPALGPEIATLTAARSADKDDRQR
jgi:hypothetical protein